MDFFLTKYSFFPPIFRFLRSSIYFPSWKNEILVETSLIKEERVKLCAKVIKIKQALEKYFAEISG